MTTELLPVEDLPTNGSEPRVTIEPMDELSKKPGRRPWKWGLVALVGLAIALAGFFYDPRNLLDDDPPAEAAAQRDTASVVLASLREEFEADGNLVFAEPRTVTYTGPAEVLTEIVDEALGVSRGDVLWRVGNEPTVVLFGELPAYRDLQEGDDGPDVEQLETNLVALGYDPDKTVTVDETYTSNTALMVERWQDDTGATVNGRLSQASAVYVPGASRVGAIELSAGDTVQSGAPVLRLSALHRILEFSIPAAERNTLNTGDVVEGRLPDRSTFAAEVTKLLIGEDGGALVTARSSEEFSYTIDVVPVSVSWTIAIGDDVLTVPAGALIRADSGQYYVEVVRASGAEEFVPVGVGRTSGITVEIIGDVAEGDTVISP